MELYKHRTASRRMLLARFMFELSDSMTTADLLAVVRHEAHLALSHAIPQPPRTPKPARLPRPRSLPRRRAVLSTYRLNGPLQQRPFPPPDRRFQTSLAEWRRVWFRDEPRTAVEAFSPVTCRARGPIL